MKKMDFYWASDPSWWEWRNGVMVVREDAPPEAQESYKRFQEQMKSNSV